MAFPSSVSCSDTSAATGATSATRTSVRTTCRLKPGFAAVELPFAGREKHLGHHRVGSLGHDDPNGGRILTCSSSDFMPASGPARSSGEPTEPTDAPIGKLLDSKISSTETFLGMSAPPSVVDRFRADPMPVIDPLLSLETLQLQRQLSDAVRSFTLPSHKQQVGRNGRSSSACWSPTDELRVRGPTNYQ